MRLRLIVLAIAVATLVPAVALGSGAKEKSLHAKLSGAAETPKGPTAGKGTAEIKIEGSKVCWELKVSGIGKPVAAHIHKGARGKAGPVIVALGKAYKAKGCTTTTAAVAKAILAKPGAYYVNVHTAKYPNGAVRGQLGSSGSSTSGGSGGYGTAGGYGAAGYGNG